MSETGDGTSERDGDGISRRDFLDGVAITGAGLAAAAAAPYMTGAEAAAAAAENLTYSKPLPAGYDPTVETGVKGHTANVVKKTIRIDGPPNQRNVHSSKPGPGIDPKKVRDTGEEYDCVIVGAGLSGLSAAKWYRDRFGENTRILLIDPLRDFGGHATRNEFNVPNGADGGNNVTLLRNGGTFNLDSTGTWDKRTGNLNDIPGSYGEPALELLDYAGVDVDNWPDQSTPTIPSSYGLRSMLLFPKEDWGSDHLVQNKTSAESWQTFLDRTPYSNEAKAAILAIQTDTTTDWIEQKEGPMTTEEKLKLLGRITYRRYLLDYVGAPEEALIQYQRNSHSLLGAGIQVAGAGDCWVLGQPGFAGLNLGDPVPFPGIGRTPQMATMEEGETQLWPDGNSSLARLLVSKMIPAAFPDVDGARPNQETIVKAECDYSQLDRPNRPVRVRLNSLVTNVAPARRDGGWANVEYLDAGKGRRVKARHVVMACWNRVTAHLVDGLPKKQVEGLCYARKVPLIYARAALNNWQAWADAKISSVSPRGNSLFWDSTSISAGAKFGDSYGPTPNEPPTAPAMLNFQVVATDHTAEPQLAAYEGGRKRLLEMTGKELEAALYDVIDRSVNQAGGDFDPERDIDSIMINRWNYGYAHELTGVWDPSLYGPWEKQPHRRGSVPYRNVSIANSDSQAFAYTHSAIQEAARAVQDLPEAPRRRKRRG
ncbi:NAD(P)/FAD-dependent oxidoreductase [Thermoleophilia bacterium SCSIO 60948]|nr:NAD(P)/FAD-dependent oxidoreductase [Thermoleophilia bacterium SCSIO 60948]